MPRHSSLPARGAIIGGAPFLAPTLPHGPMREKNAPAGLRPERERRDESQSLRSGHPASPVNTGQVNLGVRASTTGHRSQRGLEEAGPSVTAGGVQRNPRCGHTHQKEPRRGVYTTRRHRHSDLFEADIFPCTSTSGSAALHPRLLIARPLRGQQPRGNFPPTA